MNFSNQELNRHFSIWRLEDGSSPTKCFAQNEAHAHQRYIVLFVTGGEGTHVVDFCEFEVVPGRIFFVSTGQVHQFKAKAVSGYFMAFDLDFYHSVQSVFKLFDFPFFHTALTSPYLDSETHQAIVSQTLERLYAEFVSPETFGKWSILRAGLEELLIQFTRIRQKQLAGKAGVLIPNNEKLRKLELLIERNFKEQRAVTFYANQLHISARHLNNIIAKTSGKSISIMIQERLLMEAKRQLLHSEMTVDEIARQLGFSDKAYFHRFFKKHTGVTPLSFRNNQH